MAFAASKRKKIKSHLSGPSQLKLTSMIDMFTILIVFLLKSYSAVELNVISSPNLSLPTSISTKIPSETLILTVAKNAIIVEGKAVVELTKNYDVVGMSPDELVIKSLYSVLSYHSKKLSKQAEAYGNDFKGEITLQGDKDISFKLLKRVIVTAGKAEFGEFKLATYKQE